MLESPLLVIELLLLGTAVVAVVTRWRPQLTTVVATAVTLINTIVWWLLGRQLSQSISLGAASETGLLAAWRWQVDANRWALGGVLLLLATAVLLNQFAAKSAKPTTKQLQPTLILLLTATGLLALWAGSLLTLLICWTLFALLWGICLWTLTPDAEIGNPLTKLAWLLLPLWFIALAVAFTPAAKITAGWELIQWPPLAAAALALAALGQMGVLPFQFWRPFNAPSDIRSQSLLHLTPPLVGAGLLMLLADSSAIGLGLALLLTLACLLGMLSGLRRGWMQLHLPARLLPNLALATAALTYLVGLWAGSSALNAALRVYALGVGILFLLGEELVARARWWRLLPGLFALASLAGVPLTAGLISLSTLYTTWWQNGRSILILVAMILLVPLLTAVLLHLQDRYRADLHAAKLMPHELIGDVGLFLPLLGLIMLGGGIITTIPLVVWIALLLTLILSLLLPRFLGDTQDIGAKVAAAFTVNLPNGRITTVIKQAGTAGIRTVAEAANILQGDRGLVWLLIFALLYILATTL
ncbi:MAG: hypothetical protein KDE48_09215 [Anaerolineales bacterium]|nr:hypothetical protein [Anaerolineales bacterium]